VGAVVIPKLETELPILIAFMQGSLFVSEQTFLIPGMARFLFNSAFSGNRRWETGPIYQYNAAILALIGLVISCTAAYFALRLALAAARKVLTHE
jgi:ABC-type dipeptide/oligopeptide/nickel transport system permease component